MKNKELLTRFYREMRNAKKLAKEKNITSAAISAGAAAAIGEILGNKYYIKAMNFVWSII